MPPDPAEGPAEQAPSPETADPVATAFCRHLPAAQPSQASITLPAAQQALAELGCPIAGGAAAGAAAELLEAAGLQTLDTLRLEAFRQLVTAAHLKRVFDAIDTDGNGAVTPDEVQRILRCETTGDALRAVASLDSDADGRVTFPEFHAKFRHIPSATLHDVVADWANSVLSADCGTDLASFLPPSDSSSVPDTATLLRFLLAGGLGGIASRTATAPFERLKLQCQVTGRTTSILGGLSDLHAREGFSGMFRGNVLNCLRVFPFAGCVCLTYAGTLRTFKPCDTVPRMYEPFYRAGVGGFAGGVATLMTYPMDVVRANVTMTPEGQARSGLATTRAILASEGLRGLYRGLGATLVAVVPFVAFQQSLYDAMRAFANSSLGVRDSPALFLACGAFAGAGAQTVVFPLDLVRRRLQVQKGRGTALSAMKDVLLTTGVRGLYCGLRPAYAKIAPSVGISLTVRDVVKDYW